MLAVALLTPPVMLAAMVALGRYEERLLGAPPMRPGPAAPRCPLPRGPTGRPARTPDPWPPAGSPASLHDMSWFEMARHRQGAIDDGRFTNLIPLRTGRTDPCAWRF